MTRTGEQAVKQVVEDVGQSTGERSEPSPTETAALVGSGTSFFFHPVARNRSFLLLLSSFTHPHVYAPAPARERWCVRGGVKEERSLARCQRLAAHSPTLARVGQFSHIGPNTGSPIQHATRGHTACDVAFAKMAGADCHLPGNRERRRLRE